ncbi:MAG: hypothetical protein P8X55_08355 [Desulfosarcinaceae bacterium]|jgi:uncharacterized Zn finger protein (UPF0148 family)
MFFKKKRSVNKSTDLQRCPHCKKVLFRKKDGGLVCPNECGQNTHRTAFNTVIDPMKDRRTKEVFDPWSTVKY